MKPAVKSAWNAGLTLRATTQPPLQTAAPLRLTIVMYPRASIRNRYGDWRRTWRPRSGRW
jgi:hypothetical protein